ncbi:MAG: molybdopterin-dependent oxidoreductase [Dorea sp.]|nr:molybdopterin-dependent oxidoreductase [Dorea sp.]
MEITITPAICGFCGGSCLVDLHLQDGKIVKVEGNKTLPFSDGRLCVKGAALKQATYSPDRLLYPMKRVGNRGEGRFERISWEEALDTIVEKMEDTKEKYGAKSTMVYVGHPKWFRPYLTDFANHYGTPNVGSESSTCAYALMLACKCCFGSDVFMPQPDMRRCKTLLIWGVNPLYSNSVKGGKGFLGAVERGVNVIVVDPRCTPTTEHAALHLRPIPGTDGALALGMARVMITEDLYDKDYIEKYTYGFEEYKEYVMEFTPEKVEKITGVPAGNMIKAARLFASEKPSAIMTSASPVVHNINGVQNARAIELLSALTGNYGMPGGVMAPGPGRPRMKGAFMNDWMQRVDPDQDLSHDQFPAWRKLIYYETQVTRIADYLEGKGEYPIRTLLAFGMNHHMWPRPDRIEDAMQNLDFFVNVDMYMNDTCKYADILLPAATSLEREQVEILGPNILYYQPEAIQPMGEVKNDIEILLELSSRMGFSLGDPQIHSYEEYLDSLLSPTGVTLAELKEHPEGMQPKNPAKVRTSEQILQVKTPSGKIEFVSQVLESCKKPGHEGLPIYRDFREQLPMEEYPLILATGSRKPQLFHSRTYRLPWLANLEGTPVIDIHPEDARKLSLENGEEVVLRTPVGAMELSVNLDSSCLPGVVNVYHGAGEKDINYLVDDKYLDPISGFPGYKSYCCRIEKKVMENEQSKM